MKEQSIIYAYDKYTHELTDIHKNYDYLGGSHGLDWQGVTIEKLRSLGPASEEVYFKEYIFVIALEDISFNINGELIETLAGDVFINPVNSSYQLHITDTFTGIMFSMSYDFIKAHFYDKLIDDLKYIENYRIQDNNLNFLIKLIYEQAQNKAGIENLYLNQLFTSFVTYFVKNFSDYHLPREEHVLDQSCLIRIDKYIDDNFSNDVSYKDISDLSGMSTYSFLNEFKTLTRYTPHQYILNRKLKKSEQLLLNSPLSVTEISYELGFTDSSHFSKFFKKHRGVAPSQYKNDKKSTIF